MCYFLYLVLVQTIHPTIASDLKALGSEEFEVREAVTERLEGLPGWTALYFKNYARKTKDPEVQIRCKRVYEALTLKYTKYMENICIEIRREKEIIYIETRRQEMSMAGMDAQRRRVATIIANLAKLSAEDLKLAEAQQLCVFHEGFPPVTLGEMGVPVKIMIKGQPVLLCCKDCIKNAQANPDKTLARVKELKAKPGRYKLLTKEEMQKVKEKATISANLAKLSTEALKVAVAQSGCPIHEDVALGQKGVPVKIILKGQPVFLCCKDCIEAAQANPDKTLAKVEERKEKPRWPLLQLLPKELLQKLEDTPNSSKITK